MKRLFIVCFSLFLTGKTFAQSSALITPTAKQEVVKRLQELLIGNYIYLDTAKQMSKYIGERLQSGAYNKITGSQEFSQALTTDLHHVYHDGHMSIIYNPRETSAPADSTKPAPPPARLDDSFTNYGVKKAEVLYGNIGYLQLNLFVEATDPAKATVKAAFGFLQHTNALILDLRDNGGGDPEMVQYICSYLFPPKTHLNDLYERRTNQTDSFYTYVVDSSEHFQHIPVYVLTSQRTYSGAEECSYDLQTRKRALIIGENTGGGAHPVEPFQLGNGFVGRIPFARAINPVTGKNWEGTGVRPDIATTPDDALQTAVLHFFDAQLKSNPAPALQHKLQWARELAAASSKSPVVNTATLQQYVGAYGDRQVKLENGTLYFSNAAGKFLRLAPLTDHVFRLVGYDYIRLEFSTDAKTITMSYDDGFTNLLKRKS
ncbi:peptidase S41-like protein [Chitinophaga dinghuensis]|uniref:Peptidase S41-like protein n=1 Tax=Chitinophaga dinghuensis TaxID=1539050 RepID=A0A327VWN1_9BACT|nr:S41 family peptidase [Chitinophaga dinghuensis]RAJ80349.1 peptidase S41-like protein [Chitinophaga dinghuensis]